MWFTCSQRSNRMSSMKWQIKTGFMHIQILVLLLYFSTFHVITINWIKWELWNNLHDCHIFDPMFDVLFLMCLCGLDLGVSSCFCPLHEGMLCGSHMGVSVLSSPALIGQTWEEIVFQLNLNVAWLKFCGSSKWSVLTFYVTPSWKEETPFKRHDQLNYSTIHRRELWQNNNAAFAIFGNVMRT